MQSNQPIVSIQNLSKTFPAQDGRITVLDDINLEIQEGEIFGIIGKSGAGKSTLVRCINYLEKPTKGKIFFDGCDLSALTNPELYRVRQSMGMIFQQFNLLMQRTALKNVCFPLEIAGWNKQKAVERAKELLELVKMPDKMESYPNQLSGGQRQRVAIARAIALNPRILLCDEATSALDPETTRGVLSLLRDINKQFNITIVIITHEMHVIEELCQRVAILDKSKVVEIGTMEEVFSRPKSSIAKKLIFPDGENWNFLLGKRCCRIVFDGNSSFEPIIADVVLRFKQKINILFADTKNIDGQAFGQIVIQLPDDEEVADKMLAYIRSQGLKAEEAENFV